jgi:flagellin
MLSKIYDVKSNMDAFINKITSNGIDVNMGLVTYGDVNSFDGGDPIVKIPITNDLSTFKYYISI